MSPRARTIVIAAACLHLAAPARSELLSRARAGAELVSVSKACRVELRDAPLRATLLRDGKPVAEASGVREIFWLDDLLVYSVGPALGKPGIYAWRCAGGAPRLIVKPTRVTSAHPDGADLFQLLEIQGQTLRYAHAPDVDSSSLERDLGKRRKTLSLRPYVDQPAREKP